MSRFFECVALLLVVCAIGCSAEDVRNDAARTEEDNAAIQAMDAEVDAAESGEGN